MLLIATVAAAVVVYGVKPLYADWDTVRGEVAMFAAALADVDTGAADAARVEMEREALANELAAATADLSSTQFEAATLAGLQQLVERRGARVLGISPNGEPGLGDVQVHRFRLEFTGTYAVVARALIDIEAGLPHASTEGFLLQTTPTADGATEVIARVDVATWRRLP